MDYKYIEQLLKKYWKGETSLEEEQILRSFFQQEDIPQHLAVYRPVFMSFEKSKETKLGEDFDNKILGRIEHDRTVKAVKNSWNVKLQPLLKAAAVIAVAVMISHAIQLPFGDSRTAPADNGTNAGGQAREREVAATILTPAELNETDISFDSETIVHVADTVSNYEIAITEQ